MTTWITSLRLAWSPGTVVWIIWWCKFWYSCSKKGRMCGASTGSLGLRANAASRIHESLRPVSLLKSQPSCCTSDKTTPWLNGKGTVEKTTVSSSCQEKKPTAHVCHKITFAQWYMWSKNGRNLQVQEYIPACTTRRQLPHCWERVPCWRLLPVCAHWQVSLAQLLGQEIPPDVAVIAPTYTMPKSITWQLHHKQVQDTQQSHTTNLEFTHWYYRLWPSIDLDVSKPKEKNRIVHNKDSRQSLTMLMTTSAREMLDDNLVWEAHLLGYEWAVYCTCTCILCKSY